VLAVAALALIGVMGNSGAVAQGNADAARAEGVDIVEHLGGGTPARRRVPRHRRQPVKLGDYFDGKRPTLFVFAYHTCPMLCSLVLDATVKRARRRAVDGRPRVRRRLGQHRPQGHAGHGDAQARAGRRSYARAAGSVGAGTFSSATRRTSARSRTRSASSTTTTRDRSSTRTPPPSTFSRPRGRIARYLYGIEFAPGDVRLGLLEATEGRSHLDDRANPSLLLPLRSRRASATPSWR
jgi:protein SCO1/2